jgi:hypothetical protein
MRWRVVAITALLLLSAPGGAAGAQKLSQTVTGVIDATNVHYRSTIVRVSPSVPGVSWRIYDSSDELSLVNHSREAVTVYDYVGSPYLRIVPDGSVEINENSEAYYLNQSFYGNPSAVPANLPNTPDWVTVSKTAAFIWHDHRIHFLSPALPPPVKRAGVDRTTLVFKWTVPIEVGAVRGALHGKLVWLAEKPFSFPIGAIIAFVVIVFGGGAFVVVVRRRRAAASAAGPAAEHW